MSKPKRAIVLLLDSLNRHMLGCYGGTEFSTPNIDRLAARSQRFTNHYTGSLPCMPARHDILCGALDFLWKPWGSVELWERPVTYELKRQGVITKLITDHPHLFETGGENYHTDFFAWDYLRGHESDPWKTRPDPSWQGAPAMPAGTKYPGKASAYDLSRTFFKAEADYPGPKTMQATADWLKDHGQEHESFFLFVDEFDPHEPFDTPEPWASLYDRDWTGERIIWPPYSTDTLKNGVITERQAHHIRQNYGAKLSMIDHWLGKVLDALDNGGFWDNTMVILCTDHGHYLGEKDIFGKPRVMQYEPIGHTPLLIYHPEAAPNVISSLSTNVDLHATLTDLFDLNVDHVTHGRSLLPDILGLKTPARDWAVGGIFGNWVQIQDGRYKYARGPTNDNYPLSMWSNRWSTMPVPYYPGLRLPNPDARAYIDFMPGSSVPVLRQPFEPGDMLPFWSMDASLDDHYLFDLQEDPHEEHNLIGSKLEHQMIALLEDALRDLNAPAEQAARLGLPSASY